MKTLVTYFSQTGNTKQVAEAIFGELPDDRELKAMEEVSTLDDYDLAFVGFPVHAGNPAVAAREFLEGNVAGKSVALFLTHGAPEDESESEGWIETCRSLVPEDDLVGLFHCQGEVSQDVINFLLTSDDPKMKSFGERGPETKGQPDESRLQKAREFARRVIDNL